MVLLVAPRVLRAPEGPTAREARRPHFVRRRASKPARALRSLRRPSHLWGWFADVRLGASARCPARRADHRPQPGPAAAHGCRGLALSTRWLGYLKPVSPLLARMCVGLKSSSPLRVRNGRFLMQFSGAEVMPVSMVAVEGRAVVTVVSRWPVSAVTEVLLVSKLARGCA